MGSSDISGIGKVFAQSMATGSTGNADEDIRVAFKEVMSQMTALAGDTLAAGGRTPDKNHVQLAAKPADMDRSYDKYQYCDRNIKQSRATDRTANDVVRERLDKFAGDVKEVLKEELGVTDEQIEEAMEVLGLAFADLMNPNQLAALVMELTGGKDMSALLCNSEFLAVMQGVGVLTNELLGELGVSADELTEMLQSGVLDMEPVTDAVHADAADDETQNMPVTAEKNTAQKSSDTVEVNGKEQIASEEELTEEETVVEVKSAKHEMAAGEEQTDADSVSENEEMQTVTKPVSGKEEATPGKGAFDNQHPQNENQGNVAVHPHMVENTYVQSAESVNGFASQMDVQNIIRQIAEFTKVTVANHVTTMEMQLNPENLGKLYLELTSKDGVVSARITAQNEAVKEVLESQLVEVRQNMNQAGVKVDAVEVTVGSHEFERNLEQNARQDEKQAEEQEKAVKQTRRLRLDDLDELSGLMTEEETLVAQMMAEQGNSIDFTA